MSQQYYDPKDLQDFPNIREFAPEQGKRFFDYYTTATAPGKLTEREKALVALAVATVRHCPTVLTLTPISACPSGWMRMK